MHRAAVKANLRGSLVAIIIAEVNQLRTNIFAKQIFKRYSDNPVVRWMKRGFERRDDRAYAIAVNV